MLSDVVKLRLPTAALTRAEIEVLSFIRRYRFALCNRRSTASFITVK